MVTCIFYRSITSTNTHTALPPPPARASLQLTGATETRTGSGGLRRGEDKAGTVKQRKSWSGAGISPESLTRIPRLKPPTAAPLSPAGRARRQGTLESRSQVVLCPARQDRSQACPSLHRTLENGRIRSKGVLNIIPFSPGSN